VGGADSHWRELNAEEISLASQGTAQEATAGHSWFTDEISLSELSSEWMEVGVNLVTRILALEGNLK
jgi:hypothetical protein